MLCGATLRYCRPELASLAGLLLLLAGLRLAATLLLLAGLLARGLVLLTRLLIGVAHFGISLIEHNP